MCWNFFFFKKKKKGKGGGGPKDIHFIKMGLPNESILSLSLNEKSSNGASFEPFVDIKILWCTHRRRIDHDQVFFLLN